MEERLPLQRVCQPEDVADAILSLLTGSELVTGQTLVCDGGMLIADIAAPPTPRRSESAS
jgi:NAD(P)-dependent dehydrogenase (short-subunit alcohol dehydrogenase family)